MRRVTLALSAALILASGGVATAADLSYRSAAPSRYRPLAGYGEERKDPGSAGCPRQPPLDYRPRLIGEPGCYAARASSLSSTLYGTIVHPQWGVEY